MLFSLLELRNETTKLLLTGILPTCSTELQTQVPVWYFSCSACLKRKQGPGNASNSNSKSTKKVKLACISPNGWISDSASSFGQRWGVISCMEERFCSCLILPLSSLPFLNLKLLSKISRNNCTAWLNLICLACRKNGSVSCDQLSIIMRLISNGVCFYILIFSSSEDTRVQHLINM